MFSLSFLQKLDFLNLKMKRAGWPMTRLIVSWRLDYWTAHDKTNATAHSSVNNGMTSALLFQFV
jgi:hypothetical protein